MREHVHTESAGKQLPWIASSVIGTFVFRDPAAERARLERELRDLESQITDSSSQDKAEKERSAALLRERMKIPLPPQPMDDGAAERARLDELRRKRDQQRADLEKIARKALTLQQAQREVASVEKGIADLQKETDAAKNEALRRLPPEDALEKGMFETTDQYKLRLPKAQAVRSDIQRRYAAEFESEAQPYRNRMKELGTRKYPMESAKVEFVSYDADTDSLIAKINGEEYQFGVAPDKARSLYDHPRSSGARYFTRSRKSSSRP